VDCAANADPGGVSASPQCDCSHGGASRISPAQSFQQNAYGILGKDNNNQDEESITNTMATQVAALTYQSQSMQSTTANTSQRQEQQMAQIAAVQSAMHDTLHHVIAQLNALSFNASDTGHRCYVGHG
jgi:hypothetical protein